MNQIQQQTGLLRECADRTNALVYSAPAGFRGDLTHNDPLAHPFTTEHGAKGRVQINAIQDTTFKVTLTGTDADGEPIWEAEVAAKELPKLLPGAVDTIDQQGDNTLTFMLDSKPEGPYLAWAEWAKRRIDHIIETEGLVGASNQQLTKANGGPNIPPEHKASTVVSRKMGERGFGVIIEPDLKLTPRAAVAITAALRLLMPDHTIITVDDFKGRMVIATITP